MNSSPQSGGLIRSPLAGFVPLGDKKIRIGLESEFGGIGRPPEDDICCGANCCQLWREDWSQPKTEDIVTARIAASWFSSALSLAGKTRTKNVAASAYFGLQNEYQILIDALTNRLRIIPKPSTTI